MRCARLELKRKSKETACKMHKPEPFTQLFSLLAGAQLLLIAVNIRLAVACHEDQPCLTPRNRLGSYVTHANYLKLTKELQQLCLGVCSYNGTTQFLCCPSLDEPSDKRISQTQCERDHRKFSFIFITNGMPARENEFPFMAAIGWRSTFGSSDITYRCGGALITSRHLLTAAHCLYHSDEPPIVVRPGGFDLDDTEAKDIEIDQIHMHPGYQYPGVYNDIAILLLKEEYYAGRSVNSGPACLWAKPLQAANVTAIGYGNTQFAGLSSSKLMKAELSILPNQKCAEYYEEDGIIFSQLCANDPIKRGDTCQGDSGGPIIMYRNIGKNYFNVPYIVGITSFGIGCGTGAPGVYTRVASYIDWIEKVVYY